jgi:hypothetical protein
MMDTEWRKSSRSNAGGECVEARMSADGRAALTRDTQNRDAATLAVPAREWLAFLREAQAGGF